MAENPTLSLAGIVSYSVWANDQILEADYRIISFSIATGLDGTSMATLVLMDGDPATGTFSATDSGDFGFGSAIEIAMGYDSSNQKLFRGAVVGLALATQENQWPTLTVTCQGEAIDVSPVPAYDATIVTYGLDVYSFALDLDASTPTLPRGNLVVFGSPAWRPGSMIQLNGFGSRFGGQVLVSRVVHNIVAGVWTTQLFLGHN